MGVRDLLYSLYERRLSRRLRGVENGPGTSRVMLDGNRRWAREAGFVDVNDGHRVGAAKIADLLAGARRRASRSSRCSCCPPTT